MITQRLQRHLRHHFSSGFRPHFSENVYAQGKLSNRSKVFSNNSVSPSRPQFIIADENSMKEKHIWARIFKRVWGPGIDSKEWILPAYVAWRAGTITLFLLGF